MRATRPTKRVVEWDRRKRRGWIESVSGVRYATTACAFPGRRPPALGTMVSFRPVASTFGWSAKTVRGVRESVAMGATAP